MKTAASRKRAVELLRRLSNESRWMGNAVVTITEGQIAAIGLSREQMFDELMRFSPTCTRRGGFYIFTKKSKWRLRLDDAESQPKISGWSVAKRVPVSDMKEADLSTAHRYLGRRIESLNHAADLMLSLRHKHVGVPCQSYIEREVAAVRESIRRCTDWMILIDGEFVRRGLVTAEEGAP